MNVWWYDATVVAVLVAVYVGTLIAWARLPGTRPWLWVETEPTEELAFPFVLTVAFLLCPPLGFFVAFVRWLWVSDEEVSQ